MRSDALEEEQQKGKKEGFLHERVLQHTKTIFHGRAVEEIGSNSFPSLGFPNSCDPCGTMAQFSSRVAAAFSEALTRRADGRLTVHPRDNMSGPQTRTFYDSGAELYILPK
ncbi:hypothetical protein CEXT_260081 [Caerostris extrusa]|uniref:Uncharacterized protein n=1 Tax=Caerostris extrusa TaxID=172846 RepID=A0AAV4VR17_CAEEX|nr:hypothetical protein CEXT_260081 [Caerostris extrusa]